jgi:hypothetical protein
MLFSEITAVYSENHTKFINTLCVQNAELLIVKADDTCALCLKGLSCLTLRKIINTTSSTKTAQSYLYQCLDLLQQINENMWPLVSQDDIKSAMDEWKIGIQR